jgi:hypothetical protein
MPDETQDNEQTAGVRTEPRVSRITIALVFIGLAIVGAHSLNRSGFCYSRLGWVSDDEKLAFAITAKEDRTLTAETRSKIANAYLVTHPECCRVYQWKEMFGEGDEAVSAGIIPRPTYVTIKHHVYGDMLAISSCADSWALWENLPMPDEWVKEKGARHDR